MTPMSKLTLLFMAAIFVLVSCSTFSNNNKSSSKADTHQMYEEGSGRADMTMAILRPTGHGLSSDEDKYLGIIQGALYNDFNRFSAIKLFDSMNNTAILEQQRLSLSGNYSEKDYIRIGELANSQYLLTGALTKTGTTYTLNLSITVVESGISLAVFHKENIKLREIINSTVSRAAVGNLLPKLDVKLTEAGKEALGKEYSSEELEAQNALALSYEASMRGNLIDALIYSYAAQSADKSSQAAKNQAANTFKMMGGTGTAIKEDIKQQSYWKDNLIAFENFFKNHPPFELYYTSVPIQKGYTDFDRGTVDWEFTIGVRHKNVKTMEKVLNDILKELGHTNSKKNQWGFDNWPAISAESTKANQIPNGLFKGYSTFNVTAALFNNEDEIIEKITFPMYGQLVLKSKSRIKVVSTQERKLVITANGNLSTDNMYIRIININGIDADISNADNYVRNTNVGKMPLKSMASIPAEEILVPVLPEEKEKRDRELAKKQEANERKQAKIQKENNYWKSKVLAKRSNINMAVLYNPQLESSLADAFSVEGGFGFGYRNFSFDTRAVLPLRPVIDKINRQENELILGLGLSAGYSFVWKYAILGFEGGFTYYFDKDSSSSFVPLFETKIDLIPAKRGFAFRLGYRLEFGSPDTNEFNKWYFGQDRSIGEKSLRIAGSPMAGIVIW